MNGSLLGLCRTCCVLKRKISSCTPCAGAEMSLNVAGQWLNNWSWRCYSVLRQLFLKLLFAKLMALANANKTFYTWLIVRSNTSDCLLIGKLEEIERFDEQLEIVDKMFLFLHKTIRKEKFLVKRRSTRWTQQCSVILVCHISLLLISNQCNFLKCVQNIKKSKLFM